MLYQKFKIRNFKGIQELEFDFTQSPTSPIYLLVGLNESGKTTILEALSFFYDNLSEEKEPTIRPTVVNDVHDLIPKNKKDNFNDKIELECHYKLEESDVKSLKVFFQKHNYKVESIKTSFSISTKYSFEQSHFKEKTNYWDIDIALRYVKQTISKELGPKHHLWSVAWQFLKDLIPPLIYYPNFLFDFPDKIYLEEAKDEGKQQIFYRRVLQDVLDSLRNDLNIDTHIVKRIRSNKSQDIDACDSVINKMRDKITSVVLSENFNIFKGDRKNKEIVVTFPKIDSEKNVCYVEMKLKEGQDNYYIRERSLGFRWFFTFLLFTQFRIARANAANNIFFLFDEPASNLHQSAQRRLLEALETLTEEAKASVIYTTHSHHMINPKWLESTFIVKNVALDYENEDKYTSSMTNIKIEKYRTFVAKNPSSTNYFQPILDALEYKPSNLEYLPNIVLIEGKNDYYTLMYFKDVILRSGVELNLCPGNGSGSLDNVIRLYHAWGKHFIVLLDGDLEGITQKKRYNDKFGKIVQDNIYDLHDIDGNWKKKGIEKLINDEDKLKLQQAIFPTAIKYNKKTFNTAIQELLVNKIRIPMLKDTENNMNKIIHFLNDKINI